MKKTKTGKHSYCIAHMGALATHLYDKELNSERVESILAALKNVV